MEYSKEIVSAYNKWINKVTEIPTNEWDDGYKNKKRAEKRAGDKFENICKSQGLNYIKVASVLCVTKLYINKPL